MRKVLLVILALCVFLVGAVVYDPDPVAVTGLDNTWKTLCQVDKAQRYQNVAFLVKNTGGVNPFTDCQVQSYVGPTASDWTTISLTWAGCTSLAAGGSTYWTIAGNSHPKIRVQVKSAIGTNGHCQITANGS